METTAQSDEGETKHRMKRQQEEGVATTPDWMVDPGDSVDTATQSIESEIRRLQTLKTFKLLDRPAEKCYERYTSIAGRVFGAKAVLSLVDLGRTFLVAQTGWPASSPLVQHREVPRKTSFCAHAILHQTPVFVVTDASKDPRFIGTPLVQDFGVQFYAGAPLVAPNGDRIGCLAILDDQSPRPQGLNATMTSMLADLAASVMELMLEKRAVGQAVSTTATTTTTTSTTTSSGGEASSSGAAPPPQQSPPPYDVQRSALHLSQYLQQLKDDVDFRAVASESHLYLLQSACSAAGHLVSSLVTRHQQDPATQSTQKARADPRPTQNRRLLASLEGHSDTSETDSGDDMVVAATIQPRPGGVAASASTGGSTNPAPASAVDRVGEHTTVVVAQMVQSLLSAMEVFPSKAHLAFVVDPDVPDRIVCNDLKVFRSAIALLTCACERTEEGFVRFRIYPKTETSPTTTAPKPPMLVFECEDTGRDVALEQFHQLFMIPEKDEIAQKVLEEEECISVDPVTGEVQRKRVCQRPNAPIAEGVAVYPVARYVESMDGDYGYRPRVTHSGGGINSSNRTGPSGPSGQVPETGSVFWFSIPLRQVTSSVDTAIGIALGLDDEREVVGPDATDLRLPTQTVLGRRVPSFHGGA